MKNPKVRFNSRVSRKAQFYMKKLVVNIILFFVLISISKAQIAVTTLGQVYSENFDTLGATNITWTNEVTIPGWWFARSINGTNSSLQTVLFTNAGQNTVTISYNLGENNQPDRAIGALSGKGSLSWAPTNEYYYGAHFINVTTTTITNINLSYVGEQWRDSSLNAQTLNFFYRIGGTNFLSDPNNVGWTAFPSLNFSSLQNTAINMPLDGNSPVNRTNLVSNIPVNIAPDQEFWIRWSDTDFGGGTELDHTVGIDDVALTFTGIIPNNNTNNPIPINPSNTVLAVTAEFKKPKTKLRFKSSKGFKVKALLRSVNTLTKASYVAFRGSSTNAPTNLTFVNFGKFKIITKGKLKKKGVNALAQTKGPSNKAGIGLIAGSAPVTLILKIDGTKNTNAASAFLTNIFTDVRVK